MNVLIRLDEGLVLGRIMGHGVVMTGDQPQRNIANSIQEHVIGNITGRDQFDSLLFQTTLLIGFKQLNAGVAGRHERKNGIWLGIAGTLQIRAEFRVGHWGAHTTQDFATGCFKRLDERFLGIQTGAVV